VNQQRRFRKVWTILGAWLLLVVMLCEAGLAVPFFSQHDSRWKNEQMGSSSCTIGTCGCAMTDVAMILRHAGSDADPKKLNAWLGLHGGYTASGAIYWDTADDYDGSGGVLYRGSNDVTDNWSELSSQLTQGRLVIVKVDAYSSQAGIQSHWVLVTEKIGSSITAPSSYLINDPDNVSYISKTLAHYYNTYHTGATFFAMRYYSGPFNSVAPPSPPTHVSPVNGSSIDTLTPPFTWNSVSNADYYALYISEPPYGENHLVFNSKEDYGPIYGTSFHLPTGKLVRGVTYYWNMQAYNSGGGWGGFSSSWHFTAANVANPTITNHWITPTTASPRDTIKFHYTINNPNSTSVNVTLGAQIKKSGTTGWTDDMSHDRTVTLTSGSNSEYRWFTVPSSASPGDYDLRWVIYEPGNSGNRYDTQTVYNGLDISQATGSLRVTISPQGAITAGAQWRVIDSNGTTSNWHNSGNTASGLPVGSYTVKYKDISGWTKPSDDTGTIYKGQTASESGTYSPDTGSLRVTITPQGAIDAGAQWQVIDSSGTTSGWYNSGYTKSGLPVGSYTVKYKDISGWNRPSDSGTIYKNQTATETGPYTQDTGSLRVTITPQGAITAGAQWQVIDSTGTTSSWYNSGYTKSGLPVGSYTVKYKDISGWAKPADDAGTIYKNQTATESGAYVYTPDTGSLRVTISPQGAITAGAQWQVIDSTGTTSSWYNSGYTKSGLPVGSYTVKYKDISGWTKPADDAGTIYKGQAATESGTYIENETGEATISINPSAVSVAVGNTATFDVKVSNLSNGLKRANVTLSLGSNCCADITNVTNGNIPGFTYLTTSGDISADGKSVRLVAYTTGTYSGTGGTLYTLTVTGRYTSTASCPITITKNAVTDKNDTDITANTTVNNGTLTCGGPSAFPGENLSPKDHNGNGKYEDCNGDGSANYRDYILLARATEGLLSGGPAYVASNCQYFDFSGDSQCNYKDYIKLARIIERLEAGPAAYSPSGVSTRVFSQAGEYQGQPLSLVLEEAPEGLAVYQVVLSANSGTINGVNVWPLTGIGVEIAPDHKSAVVTGVDFKDRVNPGASDVQLAQIWVSGTADVEVTANKLTSDEDTEMEAPQFAVTALTGTLSCSHVMASPNPVFEDNQVYFMAEGQGIASVAVSIYDLSGRLVYESGFVMGNEVAWDTRSETGESLANGVYLYVTTVKGLDGRVIAGGKKKLVLMR